jgi:branched-chain amino acid transport system ATP-binding protein
MLRCRYGIGRSFQIPQPFGELSVFENLLVAARFGSAIPTGRTARHCAQILDQLGLLDDANRPSGSLPLLQRKRLELARALATDPQVLLLDEIAGGLTDAECDLLVETIRGIHARGVSIIWIEHVLRALTSVVERILVLNFGEMIALGEPNEVMSSKIVKEIYLGIEI